MKFSTLLISHTVLQLIYTSARQVKVSENALMFVLSVLRYILILNEIIERLTIYVLR